MNNQRFNLAIDLMGRRSKEAFRLERLKAAVTTVLELFDVFHKTSAGVDWLYEVDRLNAGIRELVLKEASHACALGKRARLAEEPSYCLYPESLLAGLLHQAYYEAYRGRSRDKAENCGVENNEGNGNKAVNVIISRGGETA